MACILLLEPDRLLADSYRQALELHTHSVLMCASAQSAIYAADEQTPDLVIMELQLIAHSGIEFLYEFRSYSEWQAIPVLILSNVPAGEFADSWELFRQELGIKAYHYKPQTTLTSLLRSVSRLVMLTPSEKV